MRDSRAVDDGNVMGQLYQDSANSSLAHTPSYSYDTMARLASAAATGSSTYNLTYSYDRYGNMTCVTNQQTNGPCPNFTYSASTNQITGTAYTTDPHLQAEITPTELLTGVQPQGGSMVTECENYSYTRGVEKGKCK